MTEETKKLAYGKQWIDEQDIDAVSAVLRSDFITQGPRIQEFEDKLARYCRVRYATVVSHGTAALHCAMFAAGIQEGDEVIVPTVTFAASANSAAFLGAKPVFVDIDPDHLCIDPKSVETKITKQTRAIVPVDFAGYPVDMEPLRALAKKHNLKIIEDAAHALGAQRNGHHVGHDVDAAIFSFHPVKNITTGEGGAIVTNDEEIYKRCQLFRTHGITKDPNLLQEDHGPWYYEMHELGYNYRITDMQAALGSSQLARIEEWVQRRNAIAELYNQYFESSNSFVLPKYADKDKVRHGYHLYVIQVNEEKCKATRRDLYDAYREENIFTQVHYIPLHLQPFYQKNFGYKRGDFPVSESYYARCLSLPMYPSMTNDDVKRVIEVTDNVVTRFNKYAAM